MQLSDDGPRLSAGVDSAPGLATSVVRALDAAGVLVDNVEVRQPSLDDVFFSLTGDHLGPEDDHPGNGAACLGGACPDGRSGRVTTTTLRPGPAGTGIPGKSLLIKDRMAG